MSPAVPTLLSAVALLAAIAALVLATLANRRWARRARPGPPVPGPPAPDGADPAGPASPAVRAELDALAAGDVQLRATVDELRVRLAELAAADPTVPQDPSALRHVAVVRYDAFADVGGRLSYSLAVLDDTRSGLVLTTLSGKSDVRTYVRAVSAGEADGTLTAEEQQAIEAATGAAGSRQ